MHSLTKFYGTQSWLTRMKAKYRSEVSPLAPIKSRLEPGTTILDVGCGAGMVLLELDMEKLFSLAIGIDVNREDITAANVALTKYLAEVGKRNIVFSECEVLQLQEAAFDNVVLLDVLHHISPRERSAFIKSAADKVAPNGKLIIKDIRTKPLWKCIANKIHDLLLARQLIKNVKIKETISALSDNFQLIDTHEYDSLWYPHILLEFRRKGS